MKLPNNCVVGAGSVVTKSFKDEGCVIAGNPAKVIGNIERIREEYQDNVYNFSNMSSTEKRREIQSHPERLLVK